MTELNVNALNAIDRETDTIPVFARWIGSWRVSVRRKALGAEELAGRYDRAAPGWRRTVRRFGYPDAYRAALRRVLTARPDLAARGPLRALDCGAGAGDLSLALVSAAAGPVTLSAVDISPRMLAEVQDRCVAAGASVTTRQADARDLPYMDGTFDLVMSAHMAEHLPAPEAAVREMARVVRPGGVLVLCVMRPSWFGAFVQVKWRTHAAPPHRAARWLEAAGLRKIEVAPLVPHGAAGRFSLVCVGEKPYDHCKDGAPRCNR